MPHPLSGARPQRAFRLRTAATILIGVVALAAMSLTGLALASNKSQPTLASSSNSTLHERIVVDAHGLTVYELRPETTHHLLCTPAAAPKGMCFKFWPPLTVHSAKSKLSAGSGVKGKLGILHRNGFFQLTLAGRPLYHFLPDGAKKGAANGQGIASFGGTWHVVQAGSSKGKPTALAPTGTPNPMPNPYAY